MHTRYILDNEPELAARAVHDPEAFTVLYEYYFPRIYNYIFCRVGRWSAADDLTSTVFEKALNRIGSYQMERAVFSTWLFTIAKNTVTDHFRMQKKEACLQGKVSENIPLKAAAAETTVMVNEDKHRLMQALSRLDDRQKNIVGLKFWGGLKNTEIAKVIRVSENHVAVILYRALKRLKTFLEETDE